MGKVQTESYNYKDGKLVTREVSYLSTCRGSWLAINETEGTVEWFMK